MAFWSGDKLAAVGPGLTLVENFDEEMIDCSAYKLTLGAECFVTPNFGDSQPHLKQQLSAKGSEVVIPPGQFAFLLTEEVVKFPNATMGFISLRSRVKLQGLINVSGFHVDPGYHGKLIYSVFNAGPSNIHLARGDDIFLLWVADLDGESGEKYRKPDKLDIQNITSKQISDVDRPLHSLHSLSGKVERLQAELTMLYRVLGVLAIIGGLIFAAWALLPSRGDSVREPTVEAIS
ncbi:MAG: deoxycytidine triphosphate deaminase [Alphaproteobacteria bacterium]|nr:MAG: deoxycytidine triphosphate deaminase [Alphaproteobacteria bacterium]